MESKENFTNYKIGIYLSLWLVTGNVTNMHTGIHAHTEKGNINSTKVEVRIFMKVVEGMFKTVTNASVLFFTTYLEESVA
jgi:hypothetical protein